MPSNSRVSWMLPLTVLHSVWLVHSCMDCWCSVSVAPCMTICLQPGGVHEDINIRTYMPATCTRTNYSIVAIVNWEWVTHELTSIHVHAHEHMHTHMCTHTHIPSHIYTHTCTYPHTHTCTLHTCIQHPLTHAQYTPAHIGLLSLRISAREGGKVEGGSGGVPPVSTSGRQWPVCGEGCVQSEWEGE